MNKLLEKIIDSTVVEAIPAAYWDDEETKKLKRMLYENITKNICMREHIQVLTYNGETLQLKHCLFCGNPAKSSTIFYNS